MLYGDHSQRRKIWGDVSLWEIVCKHSREFLYGTCYGDFAVVGQIDQYASRIFAVIADCGILRWICNIFILSYNQATDEAENVAAWMLVSAMLHRCDMGEDDLDE